MIAAVRPTDLTQLGAQASAQMCVLATRAGLVPSVA